MSTVEVKLVSDKLLQLQQSNRREPDSSASHVKKMSLKTLLGVPHNSDNQSMISTVSTQGSHLSTLPGSFKSERGNISSGMVMMLSGKPGFKALSCSSSIIGGKINPLSGNPGESSLQKAKFEIAKKPPSIDDNDPKNFVAIAPALSKENCSASLSFSSPKTTTKVVMSTVAKRVPLVSTSSGNVSKVLIQAKKLAEEASKSSGLMKAVETSAASTAVTSAPSILAARLTAPRPSSSVLSCVVVEPNESNGHSASELPLVTEAQEPPSIVVSSLASVTSTQSAAKVLVPTVKVSQLEGARPIIVSAAAAGHEGSAGASSLQVAPVAISTVNAVSPISSGASLPHLSDTATKVSPEMLGMGIKNQPAITTPQSGPKKQAVLSYERGLTRLVAVEQRTVTLVDVGMQVFIPQEAEPPHNSPDSISSVLGHLGKMSHTGLPLSKGSTVPVISTASPLTLNTLGKVVVAVPKQVQNATIGPKTFIIGGKPVTVQMKGSLGQISMKSGTTTPLLPALTGSKTMVINSPSLVATHEQGRGIAGLSLPVTEMTTPSIVVTTASLAMPTLTTPSKTYSMPVVKTPPRDSNSMVLSLDSPIKLSPSKNANESASVQILPNTTSLFIMIPNSLQSASKFPVAKVLPNTKNMSLEPELACSENSHSVSHGSLTPVEKIKKSNKRPYSQSLEAPPSKVPCTDSSQKPTVCEEKEMDDAEYSSVKPAIHASALMKQTSTSLPASDLNNAGYEKGKENIPVEQEQYEVHSEDNSQTERSTTLWSSIDTILPRANSQSDILSNKNAKQEVKLVVKNALSDFKNCLVPNTAGDMPIHVAVQEGNTSAVQRQCIVLAARKISVDIYNSREETPLQVALFCGFSPIVKVLLRFGADPTVTDKEGNSTLHLAVLYADEEAVDSLLSTGKLEKMIDDFNDEGFTALHLASHHGKVKELNLIVQHGASVDLGDAKSGRTALYHAVERRQYWAQKALLKHGADLMEPSFTGSTPLSVTRTDMFAVLNSGQQVIEVIDADTLLKKNHRKKKKQPK